MEIHPLLQDKVINRTEQLCTRYRKKHFESLKKAVYNDNERRERSEYKSELREV